MIFSNLLYIINCLILHYSSSRKINKKMHWMIRLVLTCLTISFLTPKNTSRVSFFYKNKNKNKKNNLLSTETTSFHLCILWLHGYSHVHIENTGALCLKVSQLPACMCIVICSNTFPLLLQILK